VTLAILAGGAGTRMGLPKQHLLVAGKPILEYLADRLIWPGPTLLVTTPGREQPPGTDRFDHEAVDAVENQGPLRGVLTALEHSGTEKVIIITVDMPGMESSKLNWLIHRLTARPELNGLMMQRVVEGQARIEPFPFACRRGAASVISSRLTRNNRSLHSLLNVAGFATEAAPNDWSPRSWTNLNSPDDLCSFMRSLQA
jgi:molybdopterin-guanine dinucleotide biosynthesis protein A